MIAAAKKIIARASSIIRWPMIAVSKKVARANRRAIRWAIRRRVGVVYLATILWLPVLLLASAAWALASFRPKPDNVLPFIGPILLVTSKVMAFLYLLVQQGEIVYRGLRHYRRHFGG
jgi:hypothetical protein